jgi:hypothetical protein
LEAAVELAVNYSSENIGLPGTTAIFTDVSGSMSTNMVSSKSTVSCADVAKVLCGIVAKGCERGYVFEFATDVREVRWAKTDTVLDVSRKISSDGVNGHNTNAWKIPLTLMEKKLTLDRVIILSDMQAWNDSSMAGAGGYRAATVAEKKAVCDTWAEYTRSSKAAGQTWLHCIHVNGYGDTIVDKGARVNQLAGFSEKVFGILAQTEGLLEVAGKAALPTLEQVRERWTVKPSVTA